MILTIALASACAEASTGDSSLTTVPGAPTTVPADSSNTTVDVPSIPMCEDTGYPSAPDDWYSDTPIYVGNEMPVEEVQAFASTLEGYETIWIDRDHHGWVTVGFADADVESHQASLEAEFPGVGVVAVEMEHTMAELEEISKLIGSRLPEGMEMWSVYEARGVVEVFVGRLTPERIASAEAAIGGEPACLSGQDPATTPLPGPQLHGGEGWDYLGETDHVFTELPTVITEEVKVADMWKQAGISPEAPDIDFDEQVVVSWMVLHSSSCPVTRLDDVVFEPGLVEARIVAITDGGACTADGVPRTYLVALNRDRLPAPPFRLSSGDHWQSSLVNADLRVGGSTAAADDVTPAPPPTMQRVAEVPVFIDPGFPWPATFDLSCGSDYLGVMNGVGWHRSDGQAELPPEWEEATFDGLLDVELVMTEGPEPTLTATAGGVILLYLPGPDDGAPCR